VTNEHVYNPTDRLTFEAIAYNAIGRASEINNYPAYGLIHSTGNSGWSVGFMQWDFGQRGRGEKADEMLERYQQSVPVDKRFSEQEIESLSTRLKVRGQVGNELSVDEKTKLDTFLRSDNGRAFVSELNQQQVERKWQNVGQPLSEVQWLQDLSQTDPGQAAEIIAMTAKLYNQNEIRGGRLIEHLKTNTLTSDETSNWIGNEGINGLNESARNAIVTGRDNALRGIKLMNSMENGDGQISRFWREEIHTNGNVELTQNFNNSPASQLLDKIMRDPINGERVRAQLDENVAAQRVVMASSNETARVEVNAQRELTILSPDGVTFGLTNLGWTRDGLPMRDNSNPNPPPFDANIMGAPERIGQNFRNRVDALEINQNGPLQPDFIRNGEALEPVPLNLRQIPPERAPQGPRQGPPEQGNQNPRNPREHAEPDQRQELRVHERGRQAALLNDAAHPDNREFQQMRAMVGPALSRAGRKPDEDEIDNATAQLLAQKKDNNSMREIHRIEPSIATARAPEGDKLVALYEPHGRDVHPRWGAYVKTDEAMSTPLVNSTQQINGLNQEQMLAQQQKLEQQQSQQQNQAGQTLQPPGGAAMRGPSVG
jgi:hypothetical protein